VASASAYPPRSVEPVEPAPRTHYYPAPQPVHEVRRPSRWPLALLAFASGLIGALLVGGGLFVAGAFDDPVPSTTAAPVATAPPGTVIVREVVPPADAATIASAVGRKVVPSIVTVEVGSVDATGRFDAFGSGSGVVFRADGLILTNHHVIDGATTDGTGSRVIFQDGRIYSATIMGGDELTDLAVLRIEATGLTPIEFGSTIDLEIGDRAIAIGNPLGLEGGASLTVGVVSAFDREVVVGPDSRLFNMLQTDAPITNGSSGGALVNAEGKLIGITTAIGLSESGAEGIGFATPVEVVNRIVKQIIDTGDVAHAFLGVQLRTSFEIQADGATVPNGAVVVGFPVDGVSAAEEAGLEVNDIIISWDGNGVRAQNDLINGIRASAVGETITLEVKRNGDILEFDVILGQRPEGV
jgi:S1-C subfamily serine protease